MTIPYRRWSWFQTATVEGHYGLPPLEDSNVIGGWTDAHYGYGRWGRYRETDTDNWLWEPLSKPTTDYILEDGADNIYDFRIDFYTALTKAVGGYTSAAFQINVINNINDIGYGAVTGKHYDGVNAWDGYPPPPTGGVYISDDVDFTGNPVQYFELWSCAYKLGVGPSTHNQQDNLFQNGVLWNYGVPSGPGSSGSWNEYSLTPIQLIIEYANPVVNSFSVYQVGAAGGDPLTLAGLGFDNDDDEICNVAKNLDNGVPVGGWTNQVATIDFIGLQGQGTTTLNRLPLGVDYSIISNSEIQIAAMPALAVGTYWVNLRTNGTVGMGDVSGYAGDWRCAADGRMRRGRRLILQVGEYVPPKIPIIITTWRWKKGGYLYAYYAEIDTRATNTFWDGRILSLSSVERTLDDESGLFTISDMNVMMANTDMEFSRMLASYFIKNQPVEVFFAWANQPEAFKRFLCRMLVDDVEMLGTKTGFKLRNIFQKYFEARVPKYICTIEEFANIHPDEIGKPMPEVLGRVSHTTGDSPGAVRAIYVDTTDFTYLAARGSLHAVLQVYGDGAAIDPADYAVFYADGGRTYIQFDNDQGSKKITYNAEGYMYADWDSVNGYVQNPAFILAFYIAFMVELTEDDVDVESFFDLAEVYTAMGVEEAGYLIIQDEQDPWQLFGELLFTYGAKAWPSKEGLLTVGRKDLSNYASSIYLWTQIDTLDFPSRPLNLNTAINFVKARWAYYPTANQYNGTKEASRQVSIDDFEAKLEPSGPWEFRWTDSEQFVDARCAEELMKRGYGDKIITFDLALEHIDTLDIFSSFRLEDPWGLSTTGTGEIGRYYYVTSLQFDPDAYKIRVQATDLQYLLRQYFVLGDEMGLPDNWSDAGDNDRLYGYLCDETTGRFVDGEPGKILMSEST
jgi:hypothetical protein